MPVSSSTSIILVATDGSPQSAIAGRTATDLAVRLGAELHVIQVGEVPVIYHPEMRGYPSMYEASEQKTQEFLDEEVQRLTSEGARIARSHLRMGRADVEIVELAEEIGADMIVVGNRGFGGIRRALIGSVSDSVVRHAHCPVLVVRGGN